MEPQRWLRQLVTGRLYPWTPHLATRKDMVPIDPEKARRRIEANKEILAEARKAQAPEQQQQHKENTSELAALAKELTDTENEIESFHEQPAQEVPESQPRGLQKDAFELEQERKNKLVEKDPHIQQLADMKKGGEIAAYIRKEFGEDVDARSVDIETLRKKAIDLRTDRIFEGEA